MFLHPLLQVWGIWRRSPYLPTFQMLFLMQSVYHQLHQQTFLFSTLIISYLDTHIWLAPLILGFYLMSMPIWIMLAKGNNMTKSVLKNGWSPGKWVYYFKKTQNRYHMYFVANVPLCTKKSQSLLFQYSLRWSSAVLEDLFWTLRLRILVGLPSFSQWSVVLVGI